MRELFEDRLPHNENNSTINLLGSMDKNSAMVVSALIAFLGLLPSAALSHGGGTDSRGCHTNSKTGDYHCHKRKSDTASASSQSSGSRSGNSLLSGLSSGKSRPVPTFSKKSASGLSDEDYESNENCKSFTFSGILSQAERGYVQLRCGQLIMSIFTH